MTRAIIFVHLLMGAVSARAQNSIFLSQGKIQFERKINQYAQMEAMREPGDDDGWADFSKKVRENKFKTDYFDLLFTRDTTLYRPAPEGPDRPNPFFIEPPAANNVIWCDLVQGQEIGQKKVFEQTFLLQDSLRRTTWKITDERRVIAGLDCRRANALIMDSIYVVAFYTDEILTPGGPESFSGLPGMILEVALPHEHMTWVATKVEAIPITAAELLPPDKGKKVSAAELLATIRHSLQDWGRAGRLYLWETML